MRQVYKLTQTEKVKVDKVVQTLQPIRLEIQLERKWPIRSAQTRHIRNNNQ